MLYFFFFSSRRRHTRCSRDWSSDVCSSDLFQACLLTMAERVGFEPTVQLPGQRFSRPPDSATLAPLHVLTHPPQALSHPPTPGLPRWTLFPWLVGPENRELTGNDSAD